ncbi:hypothetical protein V2J09_006925 [Rumex salicifolius]
MIKSLQNQVGPKHGHVGTLEQKGTKALRLQIPTFPSSSLSFLHQKFLLLQQQFPNPNSSLGIASSVLFDLERV